ncbi:MAG: hypothetical protein SWH78_08550 [Thermodesulfobacteriota bacterium]|nr:hypothetical protein [Thermodesulfobacteriota bacterium]
MDKERGEDRRDSGGFALDSRGILPVAGPLHRVAFHLLAGGRRPEAILADQGLPFCISVFAKPTAHDSLFLCLLVFKKTGSPGTPLLSQEANVSPSALALDQG